MEYLRTLNIGLGRHGLYMNPCLVFSGTSTLLKPFDCGCGAGLNSSKSAGLYESPGLNLFTTRVGFLSTERVWYDMLGVGLFSGIDDSVSVAIVLCCWYPTICGVFGPIRVGYEETTKLRCGWCSGLEVSSGNRGISGVMTLSTVSS